MEIEAGEHQLRVYQNNKIIDEQIFIVDEPKSIEYIIKKKYQAEYAKAIFLLMVCTLSAQGNQSIFLILNQYNDTSRHIDSSLNANFKGTFFQFTEPIQELIVDWRLSSILLQQEWA